MKCDKIEYRTNEEAKTALGPISSKTGHSMGYYKCPDCGFFHLYTKDKKKRKLSHKEHGWFNKKYKLRIEDEVTRKVDHAHKIMMKEVKNISPIKGKSQPLVIKPATYKIGDILKKTNQG